MAKSMTDLATLIADNVAIIQKDSGTSHGSGKPSLEVQEARSKVLQATQELQSAIRGPLEIITNVLSPEYLPIHIINEFGIAKQVPLEANASTTYEAIAAAVELSEQDVRRVMRGAMLNQIFNEPEPGKVVHTPASRLMVEDPQFQGYLDFRLNHILPSQLNVVEAMRKNPGSTDKAHSAFAFTHGDMALFPYLKSNPKVAKSFATGINISQRQGGNEVSHLVDNLPAGLLKPGSKVVDIGGGDGTVAIDLALANEGVQCTTQELPEIIKNHKEIPEAVKGRVSGMAHDFFTEQPVADADVYLLRNVLHNWPKNDSIRILKEITKVMKPSARIIINDRMLPEKGTVPATTERKLRRMDLEMMTLLNTRERDARDWTDLFSSPELRLELVDTIRPKFSDFAIMVLAPRQG